MVNVTNGNYQVNLKFLCESFLVFLYCLLLRPQGYNALTVFVKPKSATQLLGIYITAYVGRSLPAHKF